MAINPEIALSVRPPQMPDPLESYARLMQIKGQQQQQDLHAQLAPLQVQHQQQQLDAGQMEIDQKKRNLADMQAIDAAFSQPGGREAVLNALPGHLKTAALKQFEEIDKSHAAAADAAEKADTFRAESMGRAAVAVREHQYAPIAAQGFLSDLKQKYGDDPRTLQQLQGLQQQLEADPTPAGIKALIDPIIASSSQRKVDISAQDAAARAASAAKPTTATMALEAAGGDPAKALDLTKPKPDASLQSKDVMIGGKPTTVNFNPKTGEYSPAQGVSPVPPASVQVVNAQAAQMGPQGGEKANPTAKAMAEYRLPPISPRSMATPAGAALMGQVMAINPAYDATKFPERSKMRIQFSSGPQSQTLNSLNTAIEHLDQFVDVAKSLGNGNFRPGNEAYNWLKKTFGDSAPTNFEGIRSIMSGELASAFKKSGATDQEIKSVESAIASKNSTSQLVDYATKIAIPALGSKAATFDEQYHRVMGDEDPWSAIYPKAAAVVQKYGYDPSNIRIGGPSQPSAPAGPGGVFSYQDYLKQKGGK